MPAMKATLARPVADEAQQSKRAPRSKAPGELNLAALAANISWSTLGDAAAAGDLAALDSTTRDRLGAAAGMALVCQIADELGIAPVALVLGMMARFMASRDRHAARFARALLGGIKSRVLVRVAQQLHLVVVGEDEPTN